MKHTIKSEACLYKATLDQSIKRIEKLTHERELRNQALNYKHKETAHKGLGKGWFVVTVKGECSNGEHLDKTFTVHTDQIHQKAIYTEVVEVLQDLVGEPTPIDDSYSQTDLSEHDINWGNNNIDPVLFQSRDARNKRYSRVF